MVTASISRLRQTSQKCIGKSATNTHNGTAHSTSMLYKCTPPSLKQCGAVPDMCGLDGPKQPGSPYPGPGKGLMTIPCLGSN